MVIHSIEAKLPTKKRIIRVRTKPHSGTLFTVLIETFDLCRMKTLYLTIVADVELELDRSMERMKSKLLMPNIIIRRLFRANCLAKIENYEKPKRKNENEYKNV